MVCSFVSPIHKYWRELFYFFGNCCCCCHGKEIVKYGFQEAGSQCDQTGLEDFLSSWQHILL